jgi:amidase
MNNRRHFGAIALAVLAICSKPGGASAFEYDVTEKSVATLQADMTAGRVTAEQIVQAYLQRIAKIDTNGPALHAVIAINPDALAQARALDSERMAKGPRRARAPNGYAPGRISGSTNRSQ